MNLHMELAGTLWELKFQRVFILILKSELGDEMGSAMTGNFVEYNQHPKENVARCGLCSSLPLWRGQNYDTLSCI